MFLSQLEKFSQYCFNRSHAAGYSYTAYQCAWLKAKYPAEFIAAQLTVEGGDACYETVADYERGVRNMGIELLSLCINNSKGDYVVVDGPNQKPSTATLPVPTIVGTICARLRRGKIVRIFSALNGLRDVSEVNCVLSRAPSRSKCQIATKKEQGHFSFFSLWCSKEFDWHATRLRNEDFLQEVFPT